MFFMQIRDSRAALSREKHMTQFSAAGWGLVRLFTVPGNNQSEEFLLLNVKRRNKVVRKLSTYDPKTSAHPRCLA